MIVETVNNLEVRISEDGVWLCFKARNGMQTMLEVGALANSQRGSFVRKGLNAWCSDRVEDAQMAAKEVEL